VKSLPASASVCRLRLQRTGSTIRYLAADGPDADFALVDEIDFGTADVRPLQAGGDAGGSEAALDAILLDFTIRATDLPEPAMTPDQSDPVAWRLWGGIGVVLVLAIGLVVTFWVNARQNHAGERHAQRT
jgi:hypothetical protein